LDAAGTPKITDFGLARKQDEAAPGETGVLLGTPEYMAPEQAEAKGRAVAEPADVYALGAILYECLTGWPPHRAANRIDLLVRVISAEPVPLRRLNAKVPKDLETVCLKCLEKKPHSRYPGAAELADDLRRYLNGEPVRARRTSLLARFGYWACRPERIRDAGNVMIVSAVANFARNVPDVLRSGKVVPLLLFAIILFVQFFIGLLTLSRKLWPLFAGLALQLFGITAYVFAVIDVGLDFYDMISVFFPLVSFLAYTIALYAYYCNHGAWTLARGH
jgi:protein kinase-like protein